MGWQCLQCFAIEVNRHVVVTLFAGIVTLRVEHFGLLLLLLISWVSRVALRGRDATT